MTATTVAPKRMTIPEIRAKAKALGITPGKMKKADLIHAIQTAEGGTAPVSDSQHRVPLCSQAM